MDRIFIILKKKRKWASFAPALGLNTIIFKHVYWYSSRSQVSVYRTIGPLVSFVTYVTVSVGQSFVPAILICSIVAL